MDQYDDDLGELAEAAAALASLEQGGGRLLLGVDTDPKGKKGGAAGGHLGSQYGAKTDAKNRDSIMHQLARQRFSADELADVRPQHLTDVSAATGLPHNLVGWGFNCMQREP